MSGSYEPTGHGLRMHPHAKAWFVYDLYETIFAADPEP